MFEDRQARGIKLDQIRSKHYENISARTTPGFDNVFKKAAVCLVVGLLSFSSLLGRAEELSIDYHTHILSPEMGKEVAPLCDEMGCDAVKITKGVDAEKLLQALENSSFNRAVMLSGGYLAGMPELKLGIKTQKELTRHENAFSAEQAAKSKKLFSFFSVNPLSDYALGETRYWMNKGGHSGLKLNLVSSDVDLFNSVHVAKTQAILDVVNSSYMTIMIHLRARNPEFGSRDIEVFIGDLIPHASQANVIVAHAMGWGGYDKETDEALGAMISYIESGRVETARLFIDVAAVIRPGLDKKQKILFLDRFRSTDINNWVFGSDWSPGMTDGDFVSSLNALKEAGLTDQESRQLVSNRLPFIK